MPHDLPMIGTYIFAYGSVLSLIYITFKANNIVGEIQVNKLDMKRPTESYIRST